MNANTKFFKHFPGAGRHLVNDSFIIWPNGDYQFGDPSDNCILFNAQRLCSAFGLPDLAELWTSCYPEDPLDQADADFIFSAAEPFTADCNIQKMRYLIVKDLEAIQRNELADAIRTVLTDRGAW